MEQRTPYNFHAASLMFTSYLKLQHSFQHQGIQYCFKGKMYPGRWCHCCTFLSPLHQSSISPLRKRGENKGSLLTTGSPEGWTLLSPALCFQLSGFFLRHSIRVSDAPRQSLSLGLRTLASSVLIDGGGMRGGGMGTFVTLSTIVDR